MKRITIGFASALLPAASAAVFWRTETEGCCSSKKSKNSALVFIKPHATTCGTADLVRAKLEKAGCTILKEGSITGTEIDEKRLIDQHYYAIASKAGATSPVIDASKLPVPSEKFKAGFGEEWSSVVKNGGAVSAMQACEKFGCTAMELNEAFRASGKPVKLGGGFYVAKFSVNGHEPLYVFNPFYMAMRSKFVGPTSIYYFSVQWDEDDMKWEHFRGELLGPTNPASAPAESIRGTIYRDWKKLGLPAEPDTSDNGVHASASPLEGLAEKVNWLETDVAMEPFGAALLANGVSRETIKEWSVDPRVVVPGKEGKSSIWDAVEDMDSTACLEALTQILKLN